MDLYPRRPRHLSRHQAANRGESESEEDRHDRDRRFCSAVLDELPIPKRVITFPVTGQLALYTYEAFAH